MEELIERCAGLDVHQAELTACVRVPDAEGRTLQVVQEFGTTTPDLLALSDWLKGHGSPMSRWSPRAHGGGSPSDGGGASTPSRN